jgi:membrane associated rhomboid family serine protease
MTSFYNNPYQRRGISEELKRIFFGNSIMSRLLLINTAVFIIVSVVGLFLWLLNFKEINPIVLWLAVPADLNRLLTRPWTIFTYMFLHEGLMHLLFNMFMLYFGSTLFTEYLSDKKLLKTYIIGGIVGSLFFIVAYNIFPAFETQKEIAFALGASASVLAIFIAIASYVPNYYVYLMFIGRVKMKYIAIAFVVIDLLSIQSGNAGGHIAHLGGAFWGFVYGLSLRKGNNLFSIFDSVKMPSYGKKAKYAKFETSRKNDDWRPMTDEEYNKRKAESQKEIDRILDKIARSGYASLTKEEKDLLFRSSKN